LRSKVELFREVRGGYSGSWILAIDSLLKQAESGTAVPEP